MLFLRWLCGIAIVFSLICILFNNGFNLFNFLIIASTLVFVLDIFMSKKKST